MSIQLSSVNTDTSETVTDTEAEEVGIQIHFVFHTIDAGFGINVQVFVVEVEIDVFLEFYIQPGLGCPTNTVVELEVVHPVEFIAEGEGDFDAAADIGTKSR